MKHLLIGNVNVVNVIRMLEDIVDPVTRQNIDDAIQNLKDYQSSGRMNSTSGKLGSRAVKAEIAPIRGRKAESSRSTRSTTLKKTDKEGERVKMLQRGLGAECPQWINEKAAAGLNLAGNDTMSGRGQDDPTMGERETAAGLGGHYAW